MSNTEHDREWVGGRMTLPAQIESMGDRRAEMSLWVELPDLKVVGQVLEDPQDPQASFGQSLMRAMASPLVGEPRRPQRVRVADAALAQQLESISFLRVEVAPTPEFDKVVRALGAFFGEHSYFSDPVLSAADIERLFVAARLLWTVEPWTIAEDDALLHVKIPAMGIDNGCVSIVGSLGEAYGLAFFPSYEDYQRMTAGASASKPSAYEALHCMFGREDEVPEGMRSEVTEHGWPIGDCSAYPLLARVVGGKQAPVFQREVELATAIMRAIGTFATRHPGALEQYGSVEIGESQFDENGLEVVVSVPHPRADGERIHGGPPRALTMDTVPNPYRLPLTKPGLKRLEHVLGKFTLHRALGLFCAAVSVPDLVSPSVWLGEIMHYARPAGEPEARELMGMLMSVYNHVAGIASSYGVAGLVPESADEEACREWARGYAMLLGRVDPNRIQGNALDAAFAIQALAEIPQMLELLDDFRGSQSRVAMLAQYREALADDAGFLFESWMDAREQSQIYEPTQRRGRSKVGRNDPCPCGSGKKHKKCCGARGR